MAYLLEITPIDPLAHDLVFERFLSQERPSLPDIDIDSVSYTHLDVYKRQALGKESASSMKVNLLVLFF